MTENDVTAYSLELVRSETPSDIVATTQPNVVYTSPTNGISNQMVIIVLAVIIGVVAIVYSRNCNCARNQ